ncbi:helix-turn-helix domain-containing protein [Streptomyces luteocolor]|uniref:helix-turn-helix domain-containing protein n=1 Tax=Streptomyces luteocolor TaxID=285500 RepID=UPI000853734E|nr:helix-turn-helix transcriptional regulator [Streptomyces luteocolor]
MDQDLKRLGNELRESREQRRNPQVTQADAAEALGLSRTALQNIEHGKIRKVSRTVRQYAEFLGWPDGAVDVVMAGGTLADAEAAEREASSAEQATAGTLEDFGLSPTVEYELRSGKTLESTVINLGPDEDDGHIIVVVQGKKDATPEEIQRVAERFRRARRHLHSIGSDRDETADSQ